MKTITVKLTVKELRHLIYQYARWSDSRIDWHSHTHNPRLLEEAEWFRRRVKELEALLPTKKKRHDPCEEAANRLGLSPQAEARVFGNL